MTPQVGREINFHRVHKVRKVQLVLQEDKGLKVVKEPKVIQEHKEIQVLKELKEVKELKVI